MGFEKGFPSLKLLMLSGLGMETFENPWSSMITIVETEDRGVDGRVKDKVPLTVVRAAMTHA